MKEYQKPEVEFISFITEVIATADMVGGTSNSDVQNPFG